MRNWFRALSLNWLLISWSLVSTAVCAQVTDLASLQTQLASHSIVRGEFTQQRHLEMFAEPLSSQGTFVISKDNGLLWQQATPFPVNLVLTENKLRQAFAGQDAQVITAEENPMAFYFSRIFLAVFQGDTNELTREFGLDLKTQEGNETQWTLKLIPKQAPLNSVFKHIEIEGSSDINRLSLVELRGDKTDITFSQHNHQPETLTEAEQAQFDF